MGATRVAVVSLGGTITMTSDRRDGSEVRPSLGASDLVASVPDLDTLEVISHTLLTAPGASLTFADLLSALDWARAAVDVEHCDGVVLVQGTDTIEETAYLLDLYWNRDVPLVVTGAMRAAAAAGADGPSNLLSSVQVATSASARGLGVLVVMNDQIHAASRVRKTRSSGLGAFESPSFGPLGFVEEGKPVFGNRPRRWTPFEQPRKKISSRVALLETFLDDDGETVRFASGAGYDGIVVQGFGVGHVPEGLARAIGDVAEKLPVVIASRTGAGTTFAHTYGFTGSESDLIRRGAIPAGWLDARKSRILLACMTAAGNGSTAIKDEFRRRGGEPGGPSGNSLPDAISVPPEKMR